MNPEEWQRSMDAVAMLNYVYPMHGSGSMAEQPRKLRLYYCNLARHVWPVLPGPHRATIELAERFVETEREHKPEILPVLEIARDMRRCDGHEDDLAEWGQRLREQGCELIEPDSRPDWSETKWRAYSLLVNYALEPIMPNPGAIPRSIHLADLVRDAFPHREVPIRFDPGWRPNSAVSMAEDMYRRRDFSGMPVLADVLEEAGCTDERILDHCRDPHAMHARGCWVVDFLLERE